MIKKQFLQHGMYYSGICRNANVADEFVPLDNIL